MENFEQRALLAEQQLKGLEQRVLALEKQSFSAGNSNAGTSGPATDGAIEFRSAVVKYPKEDPPLIVLLLEQIMELGKIKAVSIKPYTSNEETTTELTLFPSRKVIVGEFPIAYFLSTLPSQSKSYFSFASSSSSPSSFDNMLLLQFLSYAQSLVNPGISADATAAVLTYLNKYLTLRTFFGGYHLTVADVALYVSLHRNSHFKSEKKNLRKSYFNLNRWINHLEASYEAVQLILKKYFGDANAEAAAEAAGNAAGKKGAIRAASHSKAIYRDLPQAVEGKVVTRFPPEPSGYLHLGHAKAALLNEKYAREYNGKLIFRYDDTNPAKESDEFVNAIKEDLKTLGIKYDVLSYTSNHFETLLNYATKLIKEGKAFVDKNPAAIIKEERRNMIESEYRNTKPEDNLKLWESMIEGTPQGCSCVLRIKMDMKSPNGTLRDPAIYRVVLTPPHHRTGLTYKVYPTYDFACPIVDCIEGVTHALRSNEYHERIPQYYKVLEMCGLSGVLIQDFSRLNFEYSLMSKRKLQKFVDNGLVDGWDSPAFPTLRGVFRRGLAVEALKEYIYSQGSSLRDTLQSTESLWSINRSTIDRAIKRFTAVKDEDKVKVVFSNGPNEVEYRSVLWCKQNPSLGHKMKIYTKEIFIEQEDAVVLKDNEEFTLMDWGNCILKKKVVEHGKVKEMYCDLHIEGDYKTTEWKITWIPNVPDLVPIEAQIFGNLITKAKLEKKEDFQNFVNPTLKREVKLIGDPALRLLPKGERIQLERRGYFICDKPFIGFDKLPLVLILIPEGKVSTAHQSSHLTL